MRIFSFILLATLLMSLLGALWHLVSGRPMLVDVPLIFVLYLALAERREAISNRAKADPGHSLEVGDVVAVLALGYIADLMAVAPKGLHGLALALVYLTGRLIRHRVDFSSVKGQLAVSGLASLLLSAMIAAVRWSAGGVGGPSVLLPIALNALATAALAVPLIRLLGFIEEKLARQSFGSALIQ